MNDVTTRQPLYVSIDGSARPYIMVLVSQLDAVRQLLDQHRIPHSVDDDVISLNGEPEVAVIDLGRGGDAKEAEDQGEGTGIDGVVGHFGQRVDQDRRRNAGEEFPWAGDDDLVCRGDAGFGLGGADKR